MDNDPLNWYDALGFGKIGFFLKEVNGAWRKISRPQAQRAREARRDVKVVGSGRSKVARNLERSVTGREKTVRHNGKPGERPHYQYKNGRKRHTFYSIAWPNFIPTFMGGNMTAMDVVDFITFKGDFKDLYDWISGFYAKEEEDDYEHFCEE